MMDPAKLKVVELRAELQTRGLDTKGNKPVLVKRLKEAFEAELQTDLPDTSIADTSTEDISSQDEDAPLAQEIAKRRVSQPLVPKPEPVSQPQPSKVETLTGPLAPEPLTPVVVEVKTAITEPEPALESVPSEPCVEPTAAVSCEPVKKDEEAMETQKIESEVDKVQEEHEEPEAQSKEEPDVNAKQEEKDEIQMDEVKSKKVEQNGENANGDAEEESVEPKAKKSRWGNETDVTVAKPESVIEETRMDPETLVPESIKPKEPEHRGDKRKHSSTSPERNQPIREDEPAVDSSKVQLSWCK